MAKGLVEWRVPLGWILGLAALVFARPTPWGLVGGLALSSLGESMRLWAAGHLVKSGGVTQSGPYRHTRNPLYFGSALLGAGFAVGTGRAVFVLVWAVLFVLVYAPVMRTEASHLAEKYPGVYPNYAASTPLFWPSPRASGQSGRFRWAQLLENREHHTALGATAVYMLLVARFAV